MISYESYRQIQILQAEDRALEAKEIEAQPSDIKELRRIWKKRRKLGKRIQKLFEGGNW